VNRGAPIALVAALALTAGCGRRPSRPTSGAHLVKRSELSANEIKYGLAPTRSAEVTYRSNVVIVDGGADIIRGLSSDGLVWTIDATAHGAADVAVGKIIFVTGRAVGKVLGVRREGTVMTVVIGPALINEIFEDAHFTVEQDVDFSEAIPHSAPDYPGQSLPLAPPRSAAFDTSGRPHLVLASDSGAPVPPAPAPQPLILKFNTYPVVGSDGVGMRVSSKVPHLTLAAQVTIHMNHPHLYFDILIKHGEIQTVQLVLGGAAGLTWRFEAGTDTGMSANVHERLTPDSDFTIPISGIGAPLAITVRQTLIVESALGVENTTLTAIGDYTFAGSFRVGYRNKAFEIAAPAGFHTKTDMADSLNGLSLGVAGLNLSHQMRVIVGVGAFGFAAGPYFSFSSGMGALKSSAIGGIPCNAATVTIGLTAGVGYLIPRSVADAINFFLRALNVGEIASEGGLEPKGMNVVNQTTYHPRSNACRQ
jgi:hypothetical protein